MIRDPLDDLLDSSAPRSIPPARADVEAMIADARRATPRPLRPRLLVAVGLTAVFASSGLGIAAATDGFSWAPWAQEPIGAVQFTMANGFECELRYSEYTGGTDPAYVGEVNAVLEDWYRSADVLAAVQAIVPTQRDELGPFELHPGETLETLPPGEARNREWAREWLAWDLATSSAEWQQLASEGFQPGDSRMAGSERSGQIQCFDENHEPYVPGAGS